MRTAACQQPDSSAWQNQKAAACDVARWTMPITQGTCGRQRTPGSLWSSNIIRQRSLQKHPPADFHEVSRTGTSWCHLRFNCLLREGNARLNLLLLQTNSKCHHVCLKVCTTAGSGSVSWLCAVSGNSEEGKANFCSNVYLSITSSTERRR